MLFEVPSWKVGAPVVKEVKSKNLKSKGIKARPSTAKETGQGKCPKLQKEKPTLIVKDDSRRKQQITKKKLKESIHPLPETLNQCKEASKLSGARFRFLNQKLYESSSKDALEYFQENPNDFVHYHLGFREQTKSWPLNPIDIFIKRLQSRLSSTKSCLNVADMGCGEAKLATTLHDNRKVKISSFDLVAVNEHVTVASMTKVPLLDGSMDVVVFSLSLMNTDYVEALVEAHRILKSNGELWIAEVSSRLDPKEDGLGLFLKSLKREGFSIVKKVSINFTRLDPL